jgi:hypothetical protein
VALLELSSLARPGQPRAAVPTWVVVAQNNEGWNPELLPVPASFYFDLWFGGFCQLLGAAAGAALGSVVAGAAVLAAAVLLSGVVPLV